jgi:hypothetical protein
MQLRETLLFYLLTGAAVAVAAYLAEERSSRTERAFVTLTALLFWPLYVPLLLSRRRVDEATPKTSSTQPTDSLAAAIAQVDDELNAALSSLDGWAENVLARERDRLGELRIALSAQAARIREMDALLARSQASEQESNMSAGPPADSDPSPEALDRWRQSELARQQNMERLDKVRRQSHADLMATLAWVRELVSMIHLAKFTGAPASRAEELLAQIAAAVEGISAVSPHEEICLPASANFAALAPYHSLSANP